ncbi:hypothetical protein T439DRAFT_132044 [Meredithblackwellia eburnea MCA 4105]
MSNDHRERKHGQAGENSPTINPHEPQARADFEGFPDLPPELRVKIARFHVIGDRTGKSAETHPVFHKALQDRKKAFKQKPEEVLLEDVYGIVPRTRPQNLSDPIVQAFDKSLVLSPVTSELLTKWSDIAEKAAYHITDVTLCGSEGATPQNVSNHHTTSSIHGQDLIGPLFKSVTKLTLQNVDINWAVIEHPDPGVHQG